MSNQEKLRFHALNPPFHVVLVEPEIPPNTGSIARTCVATSSVLHLVEPLGFSIDEHAVRRAGVDYWHLLQLKLHANWEQFAQGFSSGTLHFFSSNAQRSYVEAEYQPGDAFVFGKESTGLPQALLDNHKQQTWAIPTSGAVRSLNLSNAVAIVLYEALRQRDALSNTYRATNV